MRPAAPGLLHPACVSRKRLGAAHGPWSRPGQTLPRSSLTCGPGVACLDLRPQITRGLLQKYGADRVKDTPITEVRARAMRSYMMRYTWRELAF